MTEPIECHRCRAPMEPGFIADQTYGGFTEEQWSPGRPKALWWGMEKPEKAIPVTAMRCPRCGALESFAKPD